MKSFIIASFITFISLPGNVFAQDIKVSDVHFIPKDNAIEIYYNLAGDADEEYDVSLSLKREDVSGFSFTPIHISGDAGKGRFSGNNRKIVWEAGRDYHIDPEVNDYFFEVTAKVVKSGSSWYYYVGGALLGGGAAILLMSKGSGSASEKAIQAPPDRP